MDWSNPESDRVFRECLEVGKAELARLVEEHKRVEERIYWLEVLIYNLRQLLDQNPDPSERPKKLRKPRKPYRRRVK